LIKNISNISKQAPLSVLKIAEAAFSGMLKNGSVAKVLVSDCTSGMLGGRTQEPGEKQVNQRDAGDGRHG